MPDPETPSPRIVVFDSNVLIPLIIPASRSTRLFSRLTTAGWRVALSPQLLDEVRDKMLNRVPLRRWLKTSDGDGKGTEGTYVFLGRPLARRVDSNPSARTVRSVHSGLP